MTLREARGAAQTLKTFVQENERMRPFLQAVEKMVREMEAMTVSARSHQTSGTLAMFDIVCQTYDICILRY